PADQIKEPVAFHGKFKLALKVNGLPRTLLAGKGRMTGRIGTDFVVGILILLPDSWFPFFPLQEYKSRFSICSHHPVARLGILRFHFCFAANDSNSKGLVFSVVYPAGSISIIGNLAAR